jgi:hypothetical protein
MSKKSITKIKKPRKPKVGDDVFLIGATKYCKMTLKKIFTKEEIEYGFCTWPRHKLVDGEIVETIIEEGTFLFSLLTIVPTAEPGNMFLL